MKAKGTEEDSILRRSFRFSRQSVDTEKRTVELSFSSEEPYERGFGLEILGHNDGEIDLKRLESGGHPLLLEHDQKNVIGVIEKVWVQDGKGRAVVRFAPETNPTAEMVFRDVEAGIRGLASVGYLVHEDEPLGTRNLRGKDVKAYRATSWEPYEISIVGIPADTTVGVGRNQAKDNTMTDQEKIEAEAKAKRERDAAEAKAREETRAKEKADAEAARVKAEEEKAIKGVRQNEAARIADLYECANRYNKKDLVKKAIADGTSVEAFKSLVLDSLGSSGAAVTQPEAGTESASSGKSIGDIFVESEDYKNRGSKRGERRSVTLHVPDRTSFSQRVTFSATTESLTSIQKLPGVPGILNQQPLRVAQLFAQGVTTSLTVRYIQEDTYTNAATAVAEGSAKPEATLDVSEVDATVRKIAVYLKITDEMFADHEQMRSYVEGRLGYMVEALEDNHLINGTGATNQITGILNVSGIGTVSAASYSTPHDAIQGAITNVRSVGFIEPDAVIAHPNDVRDLMLTKDGNGQYYGGGPYSGTYGQGGFTNVSNIWGLPLVSTTAITEGTVLVGSFRMGAQLWRRMGLTIEATNSNEDDFINNLVAIRAETRLTLATYKPLAFCTVTGIA